MQTTLGEAKLTETTRAKPARRLDFLDALRGMAALLVVMQHVGERYSDWISPFSQAWFSFGRFGVTVFFLVSGFVIPYAFEKDKSVTSFWIKRFFRLYPLYWLSLLLTLALHIEPADFPAQHMARNILVNVTMLQGFVGIPNASSPYWTLFIEMAFYLAFTGWFVMRLHTKTVLWAWVGLVAFFGVSVLGPLVSGTHAPVTKAFCFVTILLGSVLYRYYNGQVSMRMTSNLFAVAVLLAGAAGYLNFSRYPSSSEHISATSVFLSWSLAFGLFGLFFGLRHHRFPQWILWLGKISYSMYLLHAVVLDAMPPFAAKTLSFLVVLGLSVCVSSVSFQFLERTFVSIGHRIAKQH